MGRIDLYSHGRSAVVVIALLLAVSVGAMAISAPATAAPSSNTTSHNQSQSSATVEINESDTTRNQVVLDRVVLPESGHIVVQNDSNVSSPSGIVGRTQYVRGGSFQDVIVKPLDESVGKNATLTISVHNETNGNGDFDFINSSGREDGPVTGPNGTPITDTIQLSKSNNKSSSQTAKTDASSKNRTNATATSATSNASTSAKNSETVTQTATPTPTPTKTPTATPKPSTPTASVSGHSQPAKETPNGSVSGAPPSDGGGGPGSGESGGTTGFAALPQIVLLIVGAMVVFAIGVMLTFAYFASDSSDTGQSTEADNIPPASESDIALTDLSHVGEDRADDLREAGYESVADVAEADRDALTDVEGIGPARVEQIAESADSLLEQQSGGHTDGDDGPSATSDAEDERPRATVTFEPEATTAPEDGDRKTSPDDERGSSYLQTIFAGIFGDTNTDTDNDFVLSVEQDDTEEGETDADSPVLSNAVTRVEDGETEDEDTAPPTEGDQSALARAKARAEDVIHEVCGRVRMIFDRRVVDLRAYGVVSEWDELSISVRESDPVNQEPLAEIIDLGELGVEYPTDDNRVRVSQENVARLEDAAEHGRPEAKRSVTLFRRVLHDRSSGTVVRRFTSEEGSNVTVE